MRVRKAPPHRVNDRGHDTGNEVPMCAQVNAGRTCQVLGCDREVHRRVWCNMHYQRWCKHGDPLVVRERYPGTLEERFWRQLERHSDTECWPWLGAMRATGYGVIGGHGRRYLAHRFAYELLVGPIPEGLVIDHLCRNRACVNPAHMEAVTQRENILRGTGFAARAARKTHCPKGHPYNAENTGIKKGGFRYCKVCNRERERRKRVNA